MRTSILIAESVSFSSIAEAKTSEKDNALKEEYYLDFAGESRLCSSLPSCICEEECICLKTKKKWKQRFRDLLVMSGIKQQNPWKGHLRDQCILKQEHQEKRERCRRDKSVERQKRIGEERWGVAFATLAAPKRLLPGSTLLAKESREPFYVGDYTRP